MQSSNKWFSSKHITNSFSLKILMGILLVFPLLLVVVSSGAYGIPQG